MVVCVASHSDYFSPHEDPAAPLICYTIVIMLMGCFFSIGLFMLFDSTLIIVIIESSILSITVRKTLVPVSTFLYFISNKNSNKVFLLLVIHDYFRN